MMTIIMKTEVTIKMLKSQMRTRRVQVLKMTTGRTRVMKIIMMKIEMTINMLKNQMKLRVKVRKMMI